MYGKPDEFSSNGTEFANQLIGLYTNSIGRWAFPVIAIAALATMLSTTITCIDAYPRVLQPSIQQLFDSTKKSNSKSYLIWMLILISGSLVMLLYFSKNMAFMVDLATTISVITAPVLAILNYKVIFHKHVPAEVKPKKWLGIYSIASIILLLILSASYIAYKVIN
ncbi:MAG: hypothetical protein C0594_14495 [Marinilabiliales bacterium]|nr:MAG: hypothetical protein C0594_14495 [Marinilabiliales bacterium]